MDFYATWLYRNVLNAEWMIWTFVVVIMVLNLLSPVFIWMIMNGKPISSIIKKKTKGTKDDSKTKST